MNNMMHMCDIIATEINKIAEKGLTSNNIEVAYKLVDMYKDLKTVEAMDEEGYTEVMRYENYPVMMDMESMKRSGRYSKEGFDPRERYLRSKESYRYSRNGSDKQNMIESLDDYMNEMTEKLQEMMKDADTQEERDTIQRYINKVKMK